MVNIFMIHGAYGHPNENWLPWLRMELEKLGHKVFVPKFPTPEGQDLKTWKNVFEKYREHLQWDSVVIGHSLGVPFLLHILEENHAKAAFFVSGFTGLLDNAEFDKVNESFVDKGFDWQKIRKNCKHFFVFHSDDDPYVPLGSGRFLAKQLGVELELVKGAGHFNEKSGYVKFDLLLEKIREVLT